MVTQVFNRSEKPNRRRKLGAEHFWFLRDFLYDWKVEDKSTLSSVKEPYNSS